MDKKESKAFDFLIKEYQEGADTGKLNDPLYKAAWFMQKSVSLLVDLNEARSALERLSRK